MDSQRRESRIEDLVIRLFLFYFVSALSPGFKECSVVICDRLISIKIMMMVVIIKLSSQRSLWRKTSPLSRSQRYAKGCVPASCRYPQEECVALRSLRRLHQLLRWLLIKYQSCPRCFSVNSLGEIKWGSCFSNWVWLWFFDGRIWYEVRAQFEMWLRSLLKL